MIVLLIVFYLAMSVVVADAADKRGHSWLFHFIGCLIFSPVLMLISVALSPVNQNKLDNENIKVGRYKRCLSCAEVVKEYALVCRCCHHDFS